MMEHQIPATMRAAQADSFGDPSVLRIRDVRLRPPRADRALVRMVATTVYPLDLDPVGGALDLVGGDELTRLARVVRTR